MSVAIAAVLIVGLGTAYWYLQPTTVRVDALRCEYDTDCVVFACSGAHSKEWAEQNELPDLPCMQYPPDEYEAKCVSRVCTAVRKNSQRM